MVKVELKKDATTTELRMNVENGLAVEAVKFEAMYTAERENEIKELVIDELIKRQYITSADEVEFC